MASVDRLSRDGVAARSWAQKVRAACERLGDDPFDRRYQACMIDVLVGQAAEADAALFRVLDEYIVTA